MPVKTVYSEVASIISAIESNRMRLRHVGSRLETSSMQESLVNSKKIVQECIENHKERLDYLVEETDLFPSGSGFDCGTHIDLANSTSNKLVFFTEFHHVDEYGRYCGWSYWTVTVTPSLVVDINVNVKMTGEDIDDFDKDFALYGADDFICEEFVNCLTKTFDNHDDNYLPKQRKF